MVFVLPTFWLSSFFFFFKQKTAYEMRISDWSSDVCSSDLNQTGGKRMSGRTGSAGAKFLLRLLLGWFALASGLVWSAAADAQLLPYRNDIAPDRQVIDSRGVDVNLGEINVSTEPVGVGDLSSEASGSAITESEEHTPE